MKKIFIKYLLPISIIPALLTGCYTQLATQDSSYSTTPSNQTYDENISQEEQVSSGGYFDESDTVGYYTEDKEGVDSTKEVVVNNYYGYVPYEDEDDYYYSSYPSVIFSFGFGYTPYYYPWYAGWYFPYYCYPAYYYPSYYWCYYPSYYSYYPIYYPYYSYGGGYYSNYYGPKYKTRSGDISQIRNTGGRGYGDTRRNPLRNPELTKTERTINNTGRVVSGLGINQRKGKERDLLSLGTEKSNETKTLGTTKNSSLSRDKTNTKPIKRNLGVRNTDRNKITNSGTTNTKVKQTNRTQTKNLTTEKNNSRTKSPYVKKNNTTKGNVSSTTKKYNTPKKTSTGRSYDTPKQTTTTKSNNPPRRTSSYTPPRTSTTRSSSPPRSTSGGSGTRSGGSRRR